VHSSLPAGVLTDQDELIWRLQRYFSLQTPHPFPSEPVGGSSLREAAVLIPVLRPQAAGGCRVLFTLRSQHLPNHAGQVSLPGGTRDRGDRDAVHTALREAEEEIGLAAEAVQVIGQLRAINLPSGFRVTPVVGLIDADTPLRACPAEVAEIFHAPGELVLSPAHYRRLTMQHNNQPRQVLELHYRHYRIWGATAAILYGLGKSLLQEGDRSRQR